MYARASGDRNHWHRLHLPAAAEAVRCARTCAVAETARLLLLRLDEHGRWCDHFGAKAAWAAAMVESIRGPGLPQRVPAALAASNAHSPNHCGHCCLQHGQWDDAHAQELVVGRTRLLTCSTHNCACPPARKACTKNLTRVRIKISCVRIVFALAPLLVSLAIAVPVHAAPI